MSNTHWQMATMLFPPLPSRPWISQGLGDPQLQVQFVMHTQLNNPANISKDVYTFLSKLCLIQITTSVWVKKPCRWRCLTVELITGFYWWFIYQNWVIHMQCFTSSLINCITESFTAFTCVHSQIIPGWWFKWEPWARSQTCTSLHKCPGNYTDQKFWKESCVHFP